MRVTVDFDPSNRDDVGRFLALADLLRTPKGEAAPAEAPRPLWPEPGKRDEAIAHLSGAYDSPLGGQLFTRLYRGIETIRPILPGPLPLKIDTAVQLASDIFMEDPKRPSAESAALVVDRLAKACLPRLNPR